MKIAITGAGGHLGRAVVRAAIEQGHAVVGLDRQAPDDDPGLHDDASFQSQTVDLTDYEATLHAIDGCDALVHLAAVPSPIGVPAHEVHNNNVVSSYNAVDAALASGIRRICVASSINAIGAAFSQSPHYDYFPIDEAHPSYCEDAYSLSKLIGEQQADAFARRHPDLLIVSLRMHALVAHPGEMGDHVGDSSEKRRKDLWGFTPIGEAATATISALNLPSAGHDVFFLVGRTTTSDEPSAQLAAQHYSQVPLRRELVGHASFFDSTKAAEALGWQG